jgi:hypothetical protein
MEEIRLEPLKLDMFYALTFRKPAVRHASEQVEADRSLVAC